MGGCAGGRRSLRTALAAAWLGAAAGASAQESDADALQRQLAEQRELLQRQAQALQQLGDRVRALEDTGAARPVAAAAPGSTDGASPELREYAIGTGLPVAEQPWGTFQFKFNTYVRYLNQRALQDEYTDAFGRTRELDLRQDIQLNKVKLDTFGWVMDPALFYNLYVWTANANQGQGAQVAGAGLVQYKFSEALSLAGGITALPGTRTTLGNFPQWLGVDNRLLADEFFRGSYTSGVWVRGALGQTWKYHAMLANNLSTLGVDAGELDAGLNTLAGALSWEPLGAYGLGMGDFERHSEPVVRIGLHAVRSRETAQAQPDTEVFENTQVRLSDGSVVFEPDLFAPGVQVRALDDLTLALDAGWKHRGFSVEGELYARWLDDFETSGGRVPVRRIRDSGLYLAASAMLSPRLQLYAAGSVIFGEYGDPWDVRLGANWFPFDSKAVRWNHELMYLRDSPVGGLAYPYQVGARGFALQSNFEVVF